MSVLKKKIGLVVEENYVYARALHYLGIDFFLDENRSLQEVCNEKGISRQQVIKCFYEFDNASHSSFSELSVYPIELLLEYLRHSHHLFIKQKLPYISYLLRNHYSSELEDLKSVFPEFVEDFIKHIYEEEDQLFGYVMRLNKIASGRLRNLGILLVKEAFVSLTNLQHDHDNEDGMANMRELIESFEAVDLHSCVILDEIKAFDREILYHATIEDNILFPRAIELEKEVFSKISELSKLN